MKHILGTYSRSTLTNVQEGDSQPNAVDLRLGRVYKINNEVFEVSNDHKKHRGSEEMFPDGDGYFNLNPGSYEVVMENVINVGEDEAGWVITRSTLNRNGCYITSGLYDSGYHGVMAGVLHVTTGPARIKQGTRIGQYLSFNSESLSSYDGDYGINKQHDKKYGV
jgi:deoxycytidine triphosphate deaminase